MSEFEVGDWVIDFLIGNEVIRYHKGYNYMSEAHRNMVLRHATPEEIKAGRRLP